jgi:hypothetical protein
VKLVSGFVVCAYFGYREGLSRRCGVWWADGNFGLDDYGFADGTSARLVVLATCGVHRSMNEGCMQGE